jgi:hypothetical protein
MKRASRTGTPEQEAFFLYLIAKDYLSAFAFPINRFFRFLLVDLDDLI